MIVKYENCIIIIFGSDLWVREFVRNYFIILFYLGLVLFRGRVDFLVLLLVVIYRGFNMWESIW